MTNLQEVLERTDRGNLVNLHHYHTKQYIKEFTCGALGRTLNLAEYWLGQKVYKVIETRDYKTFIYKVEIVLSTGKLVETLGQEPQETIYELVELNNF